MRDVFSKSICKHQSRQASAPEVRPLIAAEFRGAISLQWPGPAQSHLGASLLLQPNGAAKGSSQGLGELQNDGLGCFVDALFGDAPLMEDPGLNGGWDGPMPAIKANKAQPPPQVTQVRLL